MWRFYSRFARDPDSRSTLVALPALVAGVVALGLIAAVSTTNDAQLRSWYADEAARRLRAQDYPAAALCYERLTTLEPERAEYQWGLATCLDKAGEPKRAAAILDSLATADGPGYPPAQLLAARKLLSQPELKPGTLESAGRILRQVVRARPDSIDAHALLGQVFLKLGDVKHAVPHLERVAGDRPDVLILLAYSYEKLGDPEKSRRTAAKACAVFSKRVESNSDDLDARLRWAEAAVFLDDFRSALAVLEPGLRSNESARFRPALAQVCAVWSDALVKNGGDTLRERVALLQRGLSYDPDNTTVQDRVLGVVHGGGKEAGQVRNTLRTMLAEGKAVAIVHFILGVDAWGRGEYAEARFHWEQSHRLAPEMPIVANNLAWSLAETQPVDLPRALDLIEAVLKPHPNDARFRDTRGKILVKMERWEDALVDLEAVLPTAKDDHEIHRILARVYERLGRVDVAKEHEHFSDRRLSTRNHQQ